MAKFTLKSGNQPGREIRMEGPRLVFGRAEDCDVVIADSNISRRHAQAIVLNDLVSMMDLGSSNGTFVNELPISRVFLMDGDEVRLGETVLVFSEEEGATANMPAAAANDDVVLATNRQAAEPVPISCPVPISGLNVRYSRIRSA